MNITQRRVSAELFRVFAILSECFVRVANNLIKKFQECFISICADNCWEIPKVNINMLWLA